MFRVNYPGWGCGAEPYPHHYHLGPAGSWILHPWGYCHSLSKEEEIEHLKR